MNGDDISRRAAIETLDKFNVFGYVEEPWEKCCTTDGQILILPYGTPGDGSEECVFYRWDDDGYMYETFSVVAWMPLPEPYKGESNV